MWIPGGGISRTILHLGGWLTARTSGCCLSPKVLGSLTRGHPESSPSSRTGSQTLISPYNLWYSATLKSPPGIQEASQTNRSDPKLLYPPLPHTFSSTLSCLRKWHLQPLSFSVLNTHSALPLILLPLFFRSFLLFFVSIYFSLLPSLLFPSFFFLPTSSLPLFFFLFFYRSQYVAQDSLNLPSSSFTSPSAGILASPESALSLFFLLLVVVVLCATSNPAIFTFKIYPACFSSALGPCPI